MKIGVITDCFKIPHKDGIAEAARLGLSGVQIYATSGEFSPETLTEEQAAYFNMYQEPLEAISDTVMRNNNYAHNAAFIGQVIQTMYDNGDGGAYYDMEEEYYDNDDVVEEPKM